MQDTHLHRHKLLTKNVMFNLMGLGLPMIVAIFSIPILIAKLGTARFGILTLMWILISYASLFDLGLGRALTQQLSARLASEQKDSSATLVWTSMLGLTGLGLLGAILMFVLAPFIVHALHVPANFALDTRHAIYVMSFSLPFIIGTDSVRGVLESHQAFFIVNSVRLPMGIYTFIGPIIALYFSNSLTAIALFLAFGKIVNFILYLFACFKVMPSLRDSINFNRKDIGPLFKMGGWTTVSNIVSPLIGYLDRFFIAGVSLTAVTYYVTPNELMTKLWLIPGALNAVFFPEFAASFIANKPHVKSLLEKAIKYNFLILFPIVLACVYFAFSIMHLWLGYNFAQQSYHVLQWIAVGVLINSLAQVPFSLIQATGHSHITAKVHLVELPCYFLLLSFAIKTGSINVVAFAWFLRMIVDTFAMFYFAQKFVVVEVPKSIILLGIYAVLMLICGALLSSIIIKILVFGCGIATFYFLIWKFFLSDTEKLPFRSLTQVFNMGH